MAAVRKQTQVMANALVRMQDGMMHSWLDRSLLDDWNYLNSKDPIDPHKTRVTLRLDTNMLKWFRKLGQVTHAYCGLHRLRRWCVIGDFAVEGGGAWSMGLLPSYFNNGTHCNIRPFPFDDSALYRH